LRSEEKIEFLTFGRKKIVLSNRNFKALAGHACFGSWRRTEMKKYFSEIEIFLK
jgi:hypothetical protein